MHYRYTYCHLYDLLLLVHFHWQNGLFQPTWPTAWNAWNHEKPGCQILPDFVGRFLRARFCQLFLNKLWTSTQFPCGLNAPNVILSATPGIIECNPLQLSTPITTNQTMQPSTTSAATSVTHHKFQKPCVGNNNQQTQAFSSQTSSCLGSKTSPLQKQEAKIAPCTAPWQALKRNCTPASNFGTFWKAVGNQFFTKHSVWRDLGRLEIGFLYLDFLAAKDGDVLIRA